MVCAMFRQSADMAIISEMTAVANERDPPVAMALVSCDEGFAGTLRYCCGRGCATLCIGRCASDVRVRQSLQLSRTTGNIHQSSTLQSPVVLVDHNA